MAVRVMLVDDSAVVRGMLTRALEADSSIKVLATASNGRMAVEMLAQLTPDIVILDIEMPEMDGITALPLILKAAPQCKVIMASTLTHRNATISLEALSLGASDCLAKPSANNKADLENFYRELLAKVKALSGQEEAPKEKAAPKPPLSPAKAAPPLPAPAPAVQVPVQALAIASSTGGPQALMAVMEGLKGKLSHLPIFITQHMPPTFTTILAEQLAKTGARPGAEAKHGEPVKPGHFYLAPGDYHMRVANRGKQTTLMLDQEPPVNFCRPAADPMLASLSETYGGGLLTVVLTGMGQDGLEGARIATRNGGAVLAQDEATSIVWGMPKAVTEAGLAQAVLPLADIAPAIIRKCGG